MKVAISARGNSLKAKTHKLFGRCNYFVIVDMDTNKITALKNKLAGGSTCVGTACAKKLFSAAVQAVVSGKVGSNAYEVLKASGVAVYLSPPGLSVQETLDKFKAGNLPGAAADIEKGSPYENCYFSMR
jgi:predicted Fe-Mo cluster-binding NifX family protein